MSVTDLLGAETARNLRETYGVTTTAQLRHFLRRADAATLAAMGIASELATRALESLENEGVGEPEASFPVPDPSLIGGVPGPLPLAEERHAMNAAARREQEAAESSERRSLGHPERKSSGPDDDAPGEEEVDDGRA